MSSSVRQRGSGSSDTSRAHTSKQTKAIQTKSAITDKKTLSLALSRLKESALTNGMTAERFEKCAERVSKQMKLHPPPSRCGRLIIVLKVMWLLFLLLLALALVSVAIKPVVFFIHKVIRNVLVWSSLDLGDNHM